MIQLVVGIDLKASVNNGLIVEFDRRVAMSNVDVINESAGIGASKNEANFPNVSVKNVLTLLLQSVGVNRQGINIAMANQLPSLCCRGAAIEEAVGIDAISTILKDGVPENVPGLIVLMLPHKRNTLLILMLERPTLDGSSVSTQKIVLGCVAAEICLHFEGSFQLLILGNLLDRGIQFDRRVGG